MRDRQQRNPRSIRPEPDDLEPLDLKREEGQVILLARRAMTNVVDQYAPPGSNKLSLLAVTVCGSFADLMGGLAYGAELADVVNHQIERAGWRLVPVPRN